ncbi:MAG: putative U6 snRNA-associated protein [Streblomastix strix]|uniref:Putative U6 snRNA-associated protein n=2 Tax=Streblomastix strix TaxID=222440 RepID=A0A5J4WEA5_9EUKA|nr:MAG: putative U6 snRNA-associated protein [Streblomastix strix]
MQDKHFRKIMDFSKLIEKPIHIKLSGGREVEGILKGYDNVNNIVLDDCVEFIRDPRDSGVLTGETRKLGLAICRGTSVICSYPVEGTEAIENPFLD